MVRIQIVQWLPLSTQGRQLLLVEATNITGRWWQRPRWQAPLRLATRNQAKGTWLLATGLLSIKWGHLISVSQRKDTVHKWSDHQAGIGMITQSFQKIQVPTSASRVASLPSKKTSRGSRTKLQNNKKLSSKDNRKVILKQLRFPFWTRKGQGHLLLGQELSKKTHFQRPKLFHLRRKKL